MLALEVRGLAEVMEQLARVSPALGRRVGAAVLRAARAVRAEARARAPVFQGVLRRRISVRSVRTSGFVLAASVRPTAPHAHLVERGRRPGRMPDPREARFVAYATRLGVAPFVLARAIGAHGTRPHPFWEPAVQAAIPRIEQIIREGVEQALQEVRSAQA